MQAVQSGKITEADVDARLDELLTLVFDTHAAVQSHSRTFDADAHHALARRAAAESIVLLKNENDLLPLAEGAKVAVIGDFAQTPRYQGRWLQRGQLHQGGYLFGMPERERPGQRGLCPRL